MATGAGRAGERRGGVAPLSFRPLGTEVPRHQCPAGTKGAHRDGGRGGPGGPGARRHREGAGEEDGGDGVPGRGSLSLYEVENSRLGISATA